MIYDSIFAISFCCPFLDFSECRSYLPQEAPNQQAPNPPEFAQPPLSRSNGGHSRREGTNLGVSVPVWLVFPRREAANMGVFDSEVSKRGWREGVGDQQRPKYSKNCSPKCFSYSEGGEQEKGCRKKGLNLQYGRDFLAPTPSVCQPLFETSD